MEEAGSAVWTFCSATSAAELWPSGMEVNVCIPGAVGGDWLLR